MKNLKVILGLFVFVGLSLIFLRADNKKISFEHSTQKFKAVRTFQIVLADLDKDGDKDAVFANMGFNHSQILFNDGKGKFTDSGQKLTQCGHGIGVGDLDKDGDLDLVITSAGWMEKNVEHTFPTKIYFNDGKGFFKDSLVDLKDKEISGGGVTLIDIEKDGDLDIFIPYYQQPDRIYLNDGKGHFTNSNKIIPENAIFGDLNGNGLPDLIISQKGTGFVTMINDGKGNFKKHSLLKDTGFQRVFLTLGDLDNDRDLDVVVINGTRVSGYPTKVMINDGSGRFTFGEQELTKMLIGRSGLGDLNQDGLMDIVITNFRKPTEIWLNKGNLTFEKSDILLKKFYAFHKPVIGDVDNDRDMDIFIPHFFGGVNELWINQLKKN